ncbi:FISUMP domain-containing protein [Riemerella anatipestifer]|uniref:FISUMP domain-containing protein n=1 Tax=Riemerella anatipestifer TaxID=34085 RepID=UPI00111EB2EE|nr:FISUMP domain-containing protein [Riemerella anatipestifer]MCO7332878.1 hypothetical protein [Riemerella anatipestifer]MCO7351781.1 hypothetical protein [Riemerella anatipestifer]MCW0487038.1 hypothetical protein [Riemerella anatipestifer]MDD1596756.1 hypothetical protein [Riemerella anatipestifer]MDY3335235.1 FISUMP domain-containing protein [Riemerella anatipestifer]
MNKILFCTVFLPLALQAQVGINTYDPKATLDVVKQPNAQPKQAQGVLFPRFTTAERSLFENVELGTMIYNTDKRCIEIYQGMVSEVHHWTCMLGSNQTQSLAVKAAGFEGAYVGGIAFTDANKAKFMLENNSFSSVSSAFHDAVTVQNGSATISAGNCQWQKLLTVDDSVAPCDLISLDPGESAMLWYTLSGTPETGTLTANFSKLGAQADQSITAGFDSFTITNPKTEHIVSITYQGTPQIEGVLDNGTNKLVVKIPYKNGQGSYTAVESQEVTTAIGQDGDINTVKLTIPQGNFLTKGSLDATIVVGGTDSQYKVRLLPPGQEYIIATIPYTFNGENYQLVLKGTGGIPDRCFGKTTLECVGYGEDVKEHEFIYLPVQGPDGKTWLNNNLGAEYARVGSPWFNPAYQAGALDHTNTTTAVRLSNPTIYDIKMDWRAHGSLFQWQRNPDGHELINRTYVYDDNIPKYNSSTSSSSNSWTNPGHNQFITGSDSNGSWVNRSLYSSGSGNLWQSSGIGKTNPCPSGYHVPTNAELIALHKAILGSDNPTVFSSKMWDEQELRLTINGVRAFSNGSVGDFYCNIWSSEQYDSSVFSGALFFTTDMGGFSERNIQSNGFGVRCIKDN